MHVPGDSTVYAVDGLNTAATSIRQSPVRNGVVLWHRYIVLGVLWWPGDHPDYRDDPVNPVWVQTGHPPTQDVPGWVWDLVEDLYDDET